MIVDSHAHIGVRCEADWDFESVAEHRKHDQRFLARSFRWRPKDIRKLEDDSVVEEGWKTLWNERLLNSWEGAYDVNLRIEWERKQDYNIKCHYPIFVWEKDGVEYYIPNPHEVVYRFKASYPEVLLSLMNKVGVDKAVLHGLGSTNKFFSRVMREYPGRFIGLCHVEESTAYTKEGIEKLRFNIEELGLKGLYHEPLPGWDGYENFHTDKYDPFWREISSLGIPVYICGPYYRYFDTALPKLAKLLKKFPSLKLVFVHGLPPYIVKEGIPKIAEDIVKNHDVLLELLPKILDYGPNEEIIRRVYDAFGPSKLVWGTEFVTYSIVGPPFIAERYAEHLGYLKERCDFLSRDDLGLILGGNLQRIFGI